MKAHTLSEPSAPPIQPNDGPVNTPAFQDDCRTDMIVVSKGTQRILLSTEEIAYIYREKEYNFIKTFKGEVYLTPQTLEELTEKLDERFFFRINRQFSANIRACRSYCSLAYGKISVEFDPAYDLEVIVSQKRAKAFRQWLLQVRSANG